ncbi:EAL domain-containing protein [Ramlibacter ginsenosidimutans]|uniref:EAL domain-containing protein n=1 Tax=Ramlibacter ginsenosidimutans TaxID=502333 RepID=A0A934WQV9_9BURK|nr:EAL domain-containing protein [Ramlibacter ginsenosidimutans]MBK6009513.1 EAL domain-containing protein [Ramlibacter ginsenosidimutans]
MKMDRLIAQDSQQLLELVERSAFVGFWRRDARAGSLYWSPQLARLHGAPQDFTPDFEEALSHYVGEHRTELREAVRACEEEGKPFDLELQLQSLQGRRTWVRCVGEPLRDAHGAIVGSEGIVQEIAPAGHASGTLLRHTVSMGGAPGSAEAFVTIDRQGRISYANEQAEQLLGAAGDRLLGRKVWSFFQMRLRLALEERFMQALDKREAIELEELDAQGVHWLELRGFPFGAGMALHLRDVSTRRRAQQHLTLLEGSIARLNDIVIITEAAPFRAPGPRIVFVNDAFERRTGYTREEVLGRSPRFLQGPDTQRPQLDRIRTALEQWERVRVDLINYTKAGEPYWVDLDVSPVWDESRRLTHWVAVGRDITERKRDEEKIQYLAFYDPLTQLPNRQTLLDRLHDAVGENGHAREGALMFIDLDNFKVLNDTLGHQKGDLLLQQVGRRLRNCVAKGDLVARLGGDEFVVLIENTPQKPLDPLTAAQIVSQRVLEALGQPYVLPGYLHHSTCSIGVTLFGKQPSSVNELLKQADLAMYQAKAAGRNAVRFFDPEMQEVATANAALAADLRQAWRDNHLQIEYQPQVGLDGSMTGVEALLRWQHPTRGIVGPEEFIPTAEETSLIIPIGHWVLEAACAQLAVWAQRPDRAHLSIAVNVSVRQFRHPEFIDEVVSCVRRSGIPPDRLKLELTESLLADNLEATIARMRNLKEMGVRLSVDDFGIGYSSLSYLKRLPIDELKIDRAFVKDILTDGNDAAIAATIIDLCRNLGLEVIAEGVETEEQRAFLARQGCHRYQGYLFCRPLPLEQLEEFMDAKAAATSQPSSVET